MFPIVISPLTYISFVAFYMSYFLSRKLGISDSISKTIPSLVHSLISTSTSSFAIINFNNENYYISCSIMFGYFLSDSILSIQEIDKPGRKELLAHHVFSLLALLMPPNYWLPYFIFLAESSNVFGQITYLLIKMNQPRKLIMKSKQWQYWSFLVGRIVLWPFVFMLPVDNLTNANIYFMYSLFVPIYLMSVFWMFKLHSGYYKL